MTYSQPGYRRPGAFGLAAVRGRRWGAYCSGAMADRGERRREERAHQGRTGAILIGGYDDWAKILAGREAEVAAWRDLPLGPPRVSPEGGQ